jgi:excisionase family DNA binding protein
MSGFLTCAQVAEDLGVSTRTVLRWIDRGDLPAVRLPGGRLRVSQADLAGRLSAWQTVSGGEERIMAASEASGPATLIRPGPGKEG